MYSVNILFRKHFTQITGCIQFSNRLDYRIDCDDDTMIHTGAYYFPTSSEHYK